MKSYSFFIFFILLSCINLNAAEFYIMYDPSCMNRMVFRDNVGNELVKYSYQLNDTERLFLQTVPENQGRPYNFLPNNVFRCGNSFIGENLTKILQNPGNNVYIVKPQTNNSYNVIKIASYDYYLQDGAFTVFNGQQYRFSFSPSLVTVGNDLSSADPRGTVTFEGNINYGCAKALLFKQRPGISPSSFIDIIFVPQVGVVEQSSQQAFNSVKLFQVNTENTETYLQRFCTTESDRGVVINYGTNPVNTPTNFSNINTVNNTNTAQPTATYHIVEKNETLYSLSRTYSVSIDQIRLWNEMGVNQTLLREGTKLRVSPFQATTAINNPNLYSNPSLSNYNNVETTFSNPTNIYNTGTPAWQTSSGTHVVKPGETLASIATQYGYTIERFRLFNNLPFNKEVSPGEVLKTSDCLTNPSTGNTSNLNPSFQSQPNPNNFNNFNNTNNTNNSNNLQTTPNQPNNIDSYYFYSPPPSNNNKNNNGGNLGYQNNTNPSTGILTAPKTNKADVFEPYGAESDNFPGTGNTNNSQVTNPSLNNFNVSPSEFNNINTNRPPVTGSLGTPVPNTSPRIQINNSRQNRFDSPVPGSSLGTNPVNSPNVNTSPPAVSNNTGSTELFNSRANRKRISHVVKQGETIESIARKYSMDLDRLLQLNNMQKGQKVLPKQKIYLN